eukprot:6171822-Pleurochrysis_carterae.AAC.3
MQIRGASVSALRIKACVICTQLITRASACAHLRAHGASSWHSPRLRVTGWAVAGGDGVRVAETAREARARRLHRRGDTLRLTRS